MASVSRDRGRARLEQELQSDDYQELLRDLQRKERFLGQFTTWHDVLAFMRRGTSRDPRKDEILRPIFEAHAQDEDPRWRAILLVIFWPGLESIHFKRRGWDADPDERWQNGRPNKCTLRDRQGFGLRSYQTRESGGVRLETTARSGSLREWRELAPRNPECRGGQLGGGSRN